VDDELRAAAREAPEAVFLRESTEVVTFAELDVRVQAVVAGLASRGIRAGDRVAIAAPNGRAWLEVFFGTLRLGAVLVTLNIRYRASELEYMLNQSGARLLVTAAADGDFDFLDFYRTFAGRIPTVEQIVYLQAPAGTGGGRYEDLPAAPAVDPPSRARPADPAVILYTSGTTGRAKGAVLTQGSLLAAAGGQVARTGFGAGEVMLATMPFNHVGGLTCTILAALLARGSVILQPGFSPAAAMHALAEQDVSLFAGVPTMWKLVLNALEPRATLPSLRVAIIGGSNAEPTLCRAITTIAPSARLFNLYGLSESSGACIMSAPDDPIETIAATLGTPLPGVATRIVDVNGGAVADGADGELQIRGGCVAAGYWNLPEQTTATFLPDGWLATGDIVTRRPSGHLQLRGRAKEMFIQGGYNVYPIEVENVLVEHPAVAAAAGVGAPDAVLGETGHYFLTRTPHTPAPTETELQDFCRARLANYKVPRRIEFVDEFPLTPAGKIAKAALRARLTDTPSTS
jgi:fatty-acyl-CoA synthase